MAQDLKIELRKILALHEAALHMEHAIRRSLRPGDPWTDFAPSRFIYAFFTFNTIYSWDWETSFAVAQPTPWETKTKSPDRGAGETCPNCGHGWQKTAPRAYHPDEVEQFKGYVRFCSDTLGADVVKLFSKGFTDACAIMGVSGPAEKMTELDVTNADKRLKKLKDQMPQLVERLHDGSVKLDAFHSCACHVLRFVYGVRCNLFHGRKTRVQMLEAKQQERLLVYAALLTATNGLLFDVTARKDIGFSPVSIDFLRDAGPTIGGAVRCQPRRRCAGPGDTDDSASPNG